MFGRKQYFVMKSRVGHRWKLSQWKKKKGAEWGILSTEVHGLFIAVASPVAKH